MSGSPTASGPAGSAARATADLARRLDVDPADVEVVSAELVTWRDGSLGCPQPGMVYTQALVDGTRVVLEVAGRRYEYHSGGARGPFLCDHPEPPLPSS